MAEATRERGYAYLGLTDHSQTAHYAGGLKPTAVAAQQRQNRASERPFARGLSCLQGARSSAASERATPPARCQGGRRWCSTPPVHIALFPKRSLGAVSSLQPSSRRPRYAGSRSGAGRTRDV